MLRTLTLWTSNDALTVEERHPHSSPSRISNESPTVEESYHTCEGCLTPEKTALNMATMAAGVGPPSSTLGQPPCLFLGAVPALKVPVRGQALPVPSWACHSALAAAQPFILHFHSGRSADIAALSRRLPLHAPQPIRRLSQAHHAAWLPDVQINGYVSCVATRPCTKDTDGEAHH
eukprot:1140933-Pelagomonas_calceolata.AAC.9